MLWPAVWLAIALLARGVSGCAFAQFGGKRPFGGGRSLSDTLPPPPVAPDPVQDPTGSAILSSALFDNVGEVSIPGKLHGMVSLSAALGEDVCYWSMQQLPAPPGADGSFAVTDADFAAIRTLGDAAVSRFQALVTRGSPALFAGCGVGYHMVAKACALGAGVGGVDASSPLCSPAALAAAATTNQAWPLASIVLRINPRNEAAVLDMMLTWRNSSGGHWPAISSPQVAAG